LPRKFEDIWCHAVIKAQSAEGMELSGVDVRDLRVHSDGGDICLVYLASHPTWTARRGLGRYKYTRGGVIRDCTFSDVSVSGKQEGFTGWIYLKGRNPEEAVRNVSFKNVRYFGRPITTGDSAVTCVGAVEDVTFASP